MCSAPYLRRETGEKPRTRKEDGTGLRSPGERKRRHTAVSGIWFGINGGQRYFVGRWTRGKKNRLDTRFGGPRTYDSRDILYTWRLLARVRGFIGLCLRWPPNALSSRFPNNFIFSIGEMWGTRGSLWISVIARYPHADNLNAHNVEYFSFFPNKGAE